MYGVPSVPKLVVITSFINNMVHLPVYIRQVTRRKLKSGAVVKLQKIFVVLKTTSNVKGIFESGFAPLYRSLVTSLILTK